MSWLFDLLLELILWAFVDRRVDRSVVGKSRLDEQTGHFWKWIAFVSLLVAAGIWFFTRS